MIKKGCNQRSLLSKISNDISENQTKVSDKSTNNPFLRRSVIIIMFVNAELIPHPLLLKEKGSLKVPLFAREGFRESLFIVAVYNK